MYGMNVEETPGPNLHLTSSASVHNLFLTRVTLVTSVIHVIHVTPYRSAQSARRAFVELAHTQILKLVLTNMGPNAKFDVLQNFIMKWL